VIGSFLDDTSVFGDDGMHDALAISPGVGGPGVIANDIGDVDTFLVVVIVAIFIDAIQATTEDGANNQHLFEGMHLSLSSWSVENDVADNRYGKTDDFAKGSIEIIGNHQEN
jgi:hypothetical protein